MKIGIITLPFNWNYGGILQTYALQEVLKDLGHESATINRNSVLMSNKMKVLSYARRSILKTFFRKDIPVRTWPTETELGIIRQHTDRFIRENVKTTDLFKSEGDFNNLEKYNFEGYITGSDQVWRPKYSPKVENHFLDFIKKGEKSKRVAYAASFGADSWEFTEEQTEKCSQLAKKYDSISVREDSALDLCEKHLGVSAKLVLDPTLLVQREKYVDLVKKDNIEQSSGSLFHYILDFTPEKKKFVHDVADRLNLTPFTCAAGGFFRDLGKKRLKESIWPPVTQWIRSFMDAEFVITDSFHGTAFSLIFNKPFISIGNKKRGLTRFRSILKIVNLEDRLVYEFNDDAVLIADKKIDFEKVNKALKEKRTESIAFLTESLNS